MRKKKSVILITVVIVFLTIALIGTALVAFFSSVNLSSRTFANETKALYLAEAGISYAIYLLRYQTGSHEELAKPKGPFQLGEGTYSVEINHLQSVITSTGEVGGVKKVVQLQYNAL